VLTGLSGNPRQRGRLAEIVRNLADRITEARMNGWLGEVDGLTVSLHAATAKLTELDRTIARARDGGPVSIGMPIPAVMTTTTLPSRAPRTKTDEQRCGTAERARRERACDDLRDLGAGQQR
jgi:hypothetical protein